LGETLLGSAALERLAKFAGEFGVELTFGPQLAARGYRQRARLAVRGRSASPKLGIFQQGSHRIVDIPSCLVHHPLINEVASAFKRAVREVRAEPYADAADRGLLRYLQVVIERATSTAQVVVVANCAERAPLEPLLASFSAQLGERLQGLFVSLHRGRSNAILGPRCEKVHGSDAVREQIAGANVFFLPDAFGQSHLELYAQIVEQIGAWVPDAVDVVELYAGTGAIGLSLLPRVARVDFNEIAPGSLRGLQMGIDALPGALRARAHVHPGSAAAYASLAPGAQVAIADPPRRGLDSATLLALCTRPPGRFIYLSCGLDSFLTDARALLHEGRCRLTHLVAYDLFPFTEHVEVLACFDRD
jgi:tRNA/tmRNA/rRNA uracil-C5-methylase (TrmA/RlmC/RlmD family)